MFIGVFRIFGTAAGFLIILLSVLAGVAQILSFYYDHKNVVVESFRNIAGYFGAATVSNNKCERYEKRFEQVDCEAKESPSERLLCKVTVPPVKMVCAGDAVSRR